MLDLGSGSGVAALILAPNAQQVYATDIAPRCILFTEFNRQLNGVENIIVREGGLYQPVEGLKFDLITCHPPFDISLSSKKYIYADGGKDGEFVTRGVISGLPGMLKPGGQYIGAVRATDRVDGPSKTVCENGSARTCGVRYCGDRAIYDSPESTPSVRRCWRSRISTSTRSTWIYSTASVSLACHIFTC